MQAEVCPDFLAQKLVLLSDSLLDAASGDAEADLAELLKERESVLDVLEQLPHNDFCRNALRYALAADEKLIETLGEQQAMLQTMLSERFRGRHALKGYSQRSESEPGQSVRVV